MSQCVTEEESQALGCLSATIPGYRRQDRSRRARDARSETQEAGWTLLGISELCIVVYPWLFWKEHRGNLANREVLWKKTAFRIIQTLFLVLAQ